MIPHFFKKEPIPLITNTNLQKSIDFVRSAKNKNEALSRAFTEITSRFFGRRFHTYILFWNAFETDPNILWERRGFMHCTQQNYLLRVLLIQSGWFSESDISLGHSLVWYISPHQYVRIKIDGKEIAIDPWNSAHGAKIGTFASGFGFKEIQN